MDSFYDQPRRAPMQRAPLAPAEKLIPTHVPDVSMLHQNRGNILPQRAHISYNAWKVQQKNHSESNKENDMLPTQPSLYRKQVHFESPRTQNSDNPTNRMHAFAPTGPCLRPPAINIPKPPSTNILQSKPFEKIYMANIPNRCLDLSVIEPPKPPFTFERKQDLPRPISEYKMCPPPKPSHIAESTTIEHKRSSDDPSVKDLLKIIQQQNEQLMSLQQQVGSLLRDRTNNQIEEPVYKNKPIEGRNSVPKFAIDVMTSFEVSIRPPNNFPNRKFARDFLTNEPKIREINETDDMGTEVSNKNLVVGKKATDVSFTLNEPLVIREECPSPENSIHVDMQDFSSDSEDENSGHSSLIGWTIYNNVLDQVNYLLKRPHGDGNQAKMRPNNMFGKTTMQKVKEATIKHLKNVGVNLPNIEENESIRNDSGMQYSPTEISCAVKQLLMKYLPSEHLARISEPKGRPNIERNYTTNLIKRRPDFSLATVQYMEKYNLLNKGNGGKASKRDDKMLDITALKQQPKLL